MRQIDDEEMERWRVAGEILRRIQPALFRLALMVAEVGVAQTPEAIPEATPEISNVDFPS